MDGAWFPEFHRRRAATARVARGANAVFVPLQAVFDELLSQGPAESWTVDGVHPTPAGHRVIAQQWRAAARL